MISNLSRSLELVLKSEGGFTTDPRDPGNRLPDGRKGSTNLGVTQANWEAYVGHPVKWSDMRALTPEIVQPFYKKNYWDKVKGDDLPTPIDYLMFDFAVNAGPVRSIKIMQKAVGTVQDGIFGPKTLTAIKAVPIDKLIKDFSDEKEWWYKSLKNHTFETGWLNRVAKVETNSINMIG
jgi:lysozyme family protein